MSSTTSMRAVRVDALGGPEVLREAEVDRPSPGVSQILVAVHAAGINPSDWVHRATGAFLGRPPFVPGWDVSGVVVEAGQGVTLFKPGDEVFGMLPYPYGLGAYAEYAVGPTRAFVRKPVGVDHLHAGAVPLAGLTAWQALVDTAQVGPGDRVLVHAAAGGVGHLAVQIAKARGAEVIGTASARNHDFLAKLGVDHAIDYREVDFAEAVTDVDIVVDTVGSDDYRRRSARTLRPGGTLVSIRPGIPWNLPGYPGIRTEALGVEADNAGMAGLAALMETGQLEPTLAEVFPLAEAARAHERGETGRTVGKLVLRVR